MLMEKFMSMSFVAYQKHLHTGWAQCRNAGIWRLLSVIIDICITAVLSTLMYRSILHQVQRQLSSQLLFLFFLLQCRFIQR